MSSLTKANVNLYAAMGTLENYCNLVPSAKDIAKAQNLTVRFKVKDGPDGVVIFNNGTVKVEAYDEQPTNIVLLCPSNDKFNDVVDGKAMPLPIKGLLKTLAFMGKPESPFNILTKDMAQKLRLKEFKSVEEKRLTTILAFSAMARAIVAIGNCDERGMVSRKSIPDGEIAVEIENEKDAQFTILKKDGKLTYINEKSKNPKALMIFKDIDTAKGLIDGEMDAMFCLGSGKLAMKGFVPMIENLNKILNLVPLYLS